MLKISLHPDYQRARTVIRLEGQVSGQWVPELSRVYAEQRAVTAPVAIDLENVTFIDAAGLTFFGEIAADVALVNCSLFAAEQLKPVFERQDVCGRYDAASTSPAGGSVRRG